MNVVFPTKYAAKYAATHAIRCFVILIATWAGVALAAPAELPMPTSMPGHMMLPQEHQYQRQLRAYLATLTEKDFAHGVTATLSESATPGASADPERQYRDFLLTQMPGGVPLVGSKRGRPVINNPSALYLLSSIEREKTIELPLGYPESLMTFVQWDFPGNVYRDNRALKMRCFVNASVNLMLLDDFMEKNPGARRADWRAYQLIVTGAPYPGFKDLLPPEVRQAYQEGVKKLARQIMSWGPRGEESNFDMIIPIGLWYAGKVCDDAAFSKEVEAFARVMFTDPKHFHPAGYWIDRNGPETGFAGQVNMFAAAAALASDWPFAKEAMERVYRLRSHLILPEPDGTVTGPSAFNSRLSSPAHKDQWEMGVRDAAALMLTDEAACSVKIPTAEELAGAANKRAGEYNRQIAENPLKSYGATYASYVFWPSAELPPQPWKISIFANWEFPLTVNFAYEFYRKGAYAHLAELQKKNSPMLKYPFARGETFVRDFAKAFVVARLPDYGVVLHTGPVGHQSPDEKLVQLPSPLGFGGGQLSAFWTPSTGSVILARRGGIIHQTPHDKLEEWRTWPIHAVSGVTAEGKVFTSARIVAPETEVSAGDKSGKAKVHGLLMGMRVVPDPDSTPAKPIQDMYDEPLAGKIDYTRTFDIKQDKLHIETKVKASGGDKVAELYETIPVYLRDGTGPSTTIEFQVDGKWAPATAEWQEKVAAVKLTRFDGAVQIDFDQPVRIKLSPAEWKDTVAFVYGACRNLMIDLMPAVKAGEVSAFKEASVGYKIAAAKR
ncbi:MAG: hypothetical protein NTW19_14700 [Planctomycetota bacterium]|nr:hypothetical protein [Planctomycetota bacterium]